MSHFPPQQLWLPHVGKLPAVSRTATSLVRQSRVRQVSQWAPIPMTISTSGPTPGTGKGSGEPSGESNCPTTDDDVEELPDLVDLLNGVLQLSTGKSQTLLILSLLTQCLYALELQLYATKRMSQSQPSEDSSPLEDY